MNKLFSKKRTFTFLIISLLIAAAVSLFLPAYRPTREHAMALTLRIVLTQYKEHFGAFPAGDTQSILRALRGENQDKICFIKFESSTAFTPESDMLDKWGTPMKIYFSGNEILIRSAGPNRKFDQYHGIINDDLFY